MTTPTTAQRPTRTALARFCALGVALALGTTAFTAPTPARAETAGPPVNTSWLDYYFNNKGIGSSASGDNPNLDDNKGFHRANLNEGGAELQYGLTVGAASTFPTDPALTYVTAGGTVGQDYDNIEASGQTIDTSVALGSAAARPATKIGLVWTAHNASAIATTPRITLTYADGSTSVAQVPAGDWCSNGNADNVPVANRKPRYGDSATCTIFATQPITLTGILNAITLPDEKRLHIFAIASDADTSKALSLSEARPRVALPETVRVGDVLLPPAVEWGDLAPASTRSSWVVAGTELGWGATSRIVVPAGWLGKSVSYSVRGRTAGYAPTTTTSADAVTVAAGRLKATTEPTLAGLARVGDTLVANAGLYATDSDDSTTVGTAIQWLADGTPIAGAGGSRFVPSPAQVGATISARVTVTKQGYTSLTLTTPSSAPVLAEDSSPYPANPDPKPVDPDPLVAITRAATVTGAAKVGARLTADPGRFSPAASVAYQWLRGASPIAGATSASYRLVPADLSSIVSVRVTASATDRQAVVQLVTAGLAQPGSISAARPVVTLRNRAVQKTKVKVGAKLAVAPGTASAPGSTLKKTYQWYAGSKKVAGSAGRKATLTVTRKFRGKPVSVQVTFTAPGYVALTATSAKTTKVR